MHKSSQQDLLAQLMVEIATLRDQVSRQQAEIAELKANQLEAKQQPITVKTHNTTNRRRMLGKLAGAMLGMAVTGVAMSNPQEVQARVVSNPSPNNRIGAIILRGRATFSGSLVNTSYNYGLIATSDNLLDLTTLTSPAGSNGIVGINDTASQGNGVFGRSAAINGSGVYGENTGGSYGVAGRALTTPGVGVWGEHITTTRTYATPSNAGVAGTSVTGYGIYGLGGLAPLLLEKGAGTGVPTTGNHRIGEFYVDSSGALFYCYSGTGSDAGTWKQLAP